MLGTPVPGVRPGAGVTGWAPITREPDSGGGPPALLISGRVRPLPELRSPPVSPTRS